MIRINRANIATIIANYRNGLTSRRGTHARILDRMDFFQVMLDVHFAKKTFTDIRSFRRLHHSTRNAMMNAFRVKNRRFKSLKGAKGFKFMSTSIPLLGEMQSFLTFFSAPRKLDLLISGKPAQLLKLENDLKASFSLPRMYEKLYDFIQLIIDYNGFTSKTSTYFHAYDLAANLMVNTCPYCNAQYTFTIIDQQGETRPELDHFYSQREHPLLALSFYNLIPSCHVCNATFKHQQKSSVELLNPYFAGFEKDAVFKYKFVSFHAQITHPENFLVSIENAPTGKNKVQIDNCINTFKLEKIYHMHRDQLGQIYLKCKLFDKNYVRDFLKKFPAMAGRVNADMIYRFYFGNYRNPKDFEKQILSKFTADIVESFKLKF
ncbi:MAG: hypothetical protein EOO42_05200 [Flavobacteriales bacterium]|nr:MAG: hypothetical protein EOO42_05200 [Flavobacteriales bacterium]